MSHRGEVVVSSAELRIEAHDIAERIGEEYVEVEILVREYVAQRARVFRIGRPFILQVVRVGTFLEVDVVCGHLSLFVHHHGHTFVVDAHEGDAEECTSGIATLGETSTAHKGNHITTVEEFRDFSVGVGVNEASAPREILLFDVGGRDAKLHTIRAHLSYVSSTFHFSAETLGNHDTHFVEVVTAINVESHTNAVLPQTSIETEVKLVFLFVGQGVVTHL